MNEYDFNKAEPAEQQDLAPESNAKPVPPAEYMPWPQQEHKAEPEPEPAPAPAPAEYVPWPKPAQEASFRPPQGNSGMGEYQTPVNQRSYGEPYSPYNRQYDGSRSQGTYGRRGQNPNPYQYSATSGWQQGRPKDGFEWDFQEYDDLIKFKKRGKNRGVVVFAVSLLCILSVGLISLTGYNIFRALTSEKADPGSEVTAPETAETGEPVSRPQAGGSDEISMNINSKPFVPEETVLPGERMTIPQVARAVSPAVVGIVNYRTTQFYEPFTEGSGIIISDDGYIVTNTHVVEGADGLVVVFNDETEVEATVIGMDARTDLAVIKVDLTGLAPAIFGDSTQLEVGETVVAIGNPGGVELAGSVTRGIVSAVNRLVKTPYYSTNYIQTDAAINPGNSGGALCNEFGQVVGINTAKIVAEGYEGIGFAIPINEAIPIIEDLIKNGRVTGRVLLGITGENVSEIISRNMNVPVGVQIIGISSDELTNMGVLRGDIITHIDDERIWDINDIQNILKNHKAGDKVKLTLFRQTRVTTSNTFDVTVALIEDTGT